ncbi:MAG: helix-turn-helix domain-containing protein [Gemmatimonadales bacterium]
MQATTRKPQQARSAESYQRMLDAAEEILGEKSFDDATISEIAARAGLTIGAFYARFRDKDSLLGELEARMDADFVTLVDESLSPERWDGLTLQETMNRHHLALVKLYQRRRAIGRALVLRSHTDPLLKARLEKLNQVNLPRIAQLILKRTKIQHPHPERAVRFALLAVRSICREVVLFREGWPGTKTPSAREIAEELTRLFIGYLGVSAKAR